MSKSTKRRILITSASNKVPLIKCLQKAVLKFDPAIELISGDSDINCISHYFTDDFWLMPKLEDVQLESFVATLIEKDICFIIPTRDGELPFFSKHRDYFTSHNIQVMVSSEASIIPCLDKLKFYQVLSEANFPVIPTSLDIANLRSNAFVVKERYGAGALNLGLELSKENALAHGKLLKTPVFQPFIEGIEVSVDAYMNKKKRVQGIIIRQRNLVIDGESQITTTIQDDKLEAVCKQIFELLGLYGHCMLQIIIDSTGIFHVVECNSRFGGASSLSYEMGLESFYWFLLETAHKELSPFVRPLHEKRMIRYTEDLFI